LKSNGSSSSRVNEGRFWLLDGRSLEGTVRLDEVVGGGEVGREEATRLKAFLQYVKGKRSSARRFPWDSKRGEKEG
jgi:hypothetical protein